MKCIDTNINKARNVTVMQFLVAWPKIMTDPVDSGGTDTLRGAQGLMCATKCGDRTLGQKSAKGHKRRILLPYDQCFVLVL